MVRAVVEVTLRRPNILPAGFVCHELTGAMSMISFSTDSSDMIAAAPFAASAARSPFDQDLQTVDAVRSISCVFCRKMALFSPRRQSRNRLKVRFFPNTGSGLSGTGEPQPKR